MKNELDALMLAIELALNPRPARLVEDNEDATS
jgi:hypothetical protein